MCGRFARQASQRTGPSSDKSPRYTTWGLKASAQSRKTKSPAAPNLHPGFLTNPPKEQKQGKNKERQGDCHGNTVQRAGAMDVVVIQAGRAQRLNNYPVCLCQRSVNVTSRLYMSLCETFPLLDDATVGLLCCEIVSSPVQLNLTWHRP